MGGRIRSTFIKAPADAGGIFTELNSAAAVRVSVMTLSFFSWQEPVTGKTDV